MTNFRRLFLSLVLTMVACCGTCRAGLIAQHLGSVDPTTEGWTALPGSGGGVVVGPIDDGGTPAWFVDDNSTALNSIYLYEHIISSAEIAAGNSLGWTLSTTLRVAADGSSTLDVTPVVTYRDGVNGWQMNFGLDGSGDTFVKLFTGATTGPVHTIAGNSTYNTFSLRYDPVAANADLFVNGTEVISDYTGFSNTQTAVLWGAGRSDFTGQGNFNEVSFETVPEPSSISLWLIAGTGVFVGHRSRNRRQTSRNRRMPETGS